MKKICTECHGLPRANKFYNLTDGRAYTLEKDPEEIEGDYFGWVRNDFGGYVRVNMKRFVDAAEICSTLKAR